MAVDKDSKAAQKASEQAAAPAKSSGLDAILAEITKKKKVGSIESITGVGIAR